MAVVATGERCRRPPSLPSSARGFAGLSTLSSAGTSIAPRKLALRYPKPKEENMGTPSILPFDAPNRQQIAQGHPPDWRPPRPKDAYDSWSSAAARPG